MVEPVSIEVGTISLAKVCLGIARRISTFFNKVNRVDETLNSISSRIKSLATILTQVSNAYETEKADGDSESFRALTEYWSTIQEIVANCEVFLKELKKTIVDLRVDTEGRLLRKVVNQGMIEWRQSEMEWYSAMIDVCYQEMQSAFDVLNLYVPF